MFLLGFLLGGGGGGVVLSFNQIECVRLCSSVIIVRNCTVGERCSPWDSCISIANSLNSIQY